MTDRAEVPPWWEQEPWLPPDMHHAVSHWIM